MVPTLGKANKQHYRYIGNWLVSHVIAGLLPLWGSYFYLLLRKRDPLFLDSFQHGEFALYAAGLLGTAFFVLFFERTGPFPKRAGYGWMSVPLLIVSVLIFAGAVDPKAGALDPTVLVWSSLATYGASLLLTMRLLVIDQLRAEYDPRALEEEQLDQLAHDFHDEGPNA
jgi:hypothetical protein